MLASATGSNLRTLLKLQSERPDFYEVALVIVHGPRVGAIEVALGAQIETWIGDFDAVCGLRSEAQTQQDVYDYQERSRAWHDDLCARLELWESRNGALDVLVLAYHRILDGNLLQKFENRIVNMHPADLAVLDERGRRRYVGKRGVELAMLDGQPATRTSCFLVNEGMDEGSLVCRGPWVSVAGSRSAEEQERKQKLHSDPPALRWTMSMLAQRRLTLGEEVHVDGSRALHLDGRPLPRGGHDLTEAKGGA